MHFPNPQNLQQQKFDLRRSNQKSSEKQAISGDAPFPARHATPVPGGRAKSDANLKTINFWLKIKK
jgi:hypothetical protein